MLDWLNWKNIGWGFIVIASSPIWLPKICFDLGLMISDNIRKYYTK